MLDLALGNRIFINNELDAAIQELDILFSTERGQMIGNMDYGTNWYQFLYALTPMESSLEQYITDLLVHTHYCKNLNVNVSVEYIPGEVTSSYLVKIAISDPEYNQSINKSYIIK